MTKFKNLTENTAGFFKIISQSHIGAFAAQSAFFLVISFFPLTILTLSFVNVLNVDLSELYDFIGFSLITIEKESSIAPVISLSTILAAWSSGKAFSSLRAGFQFMMKFNPENGYVKLRIRGLLVSLIFSVLIAFITIIGMFGQRLIDYIMYNYNVLFDFAKIAEITRKLFLVFVMFLITFLLYRFLPDWKSWETSSGRKVKNKYLLLISFIVSLSVYTYTVFFSIYVTDYANYASIYKNMASLVSVMILIYGAMFTIILGFKIVLLMHENQSVGN